MPLTPEQLQELQELEELEELERQFGSSAQKPALPSRPGQAALEGFGQTASFGYLPQLQAGAEKGVDKLAALLGVSSAGVDESLKAQGFKVPEQSYVQMRDQNIQRQQELAESNPTATLAGKGAGMIATSVVPMGNAGRGASLAKNVVQGAKAGALTGALYNPGDEQGVVDVFQAGARAKNAALGAATGAAGGVASKGLEKTGDWAMQRAVGRKKYTPGVGTTLAEEGVVGTKGMMRKQVEKKLPKRYNDMKSAAGSIQGKVDSRQVAGQVDELADQFIPTNGLPADVDTPKVEKLWDMAEDIRSRGEIGPLDALERRGIAGGRAYKKDDPLESLLGQASKREQAGYSQALKEGYAKTFPGQPNKMAEADKAYGALARASRSLNEEETLARSLLGLATKTGAGAGLGYMVGGPQGALAGAALGSPLGMSAIGQATTRMAPKLAPAAQMSLKAALEGKRKK